MTLTRDARQFNSFTLLYCGCPCLVHIGHRRDIRQRYNIEGSGGSDLRVFTFHPHCIHSLIFVLSVTFLSASARGAASLAHSRKNRAKSSSRSIALLVLTKDPHRLLHRPFVSWQVRPLFSCCPHASRSAKRNHLSALSLTHVSFRFDVSLYSSRQNYILPSSTRPLCSAFILSCSLRTFISCSLIDGYPPQHRFSFFVHQDLTTCIRSDMLRGMPSVRYIAASCLSRMQSEILILYSKSGDA